MESLRSPVGVRPRALAWLMLGMLLAPRAQPQPTELREKLYCCDPQPELLDLSGTYEGYYPDGVKLFRSVLEHNARRAYGMRDFLTLSLVDRMQTETGELQMYTGQRQIIYRPLFGANGVCEGGLFAECVRRPITINYTVSGTVEWLFTPEGAAAKAIHLEGLIAGATETTLDYGTRIRVAYTRGDSANPQNAVVWRDLRGGVLLQIVFGMAQFPEPGFDGGWEWVETFDNPLQDCPCSLSDGTNRPQTMYYQRVSSLPPLQAGADIRMTLEAAQPVEPVGGEFRPEGEIVLLRQPRYVRARGAEESVNDYNAFLANERQAMETTAHRATRDGEIYRFADVPFFQAGGDILQPAYYTIAALNTEIEEAIFDGTSTVTQTTHFITEYLYNVTAGSDQTMTLRPLDGIGQKEDLIAQLITRAPNNYGPVENQVQVYLNSLKGGSVTAEQAEGLGRAIWAERAARDGAEYAEQLIEKTLKGLATVIGDVIKEFNKFQRKGIKERRKKLKQLNEKLDTETLRSGGFRLDGTTVEKTELINAIDSLLTEDPAFFLSVVARHVKTAGKLAAQFIYGVLRGFGMEDSRAKQVADAFKLCVNIITEIVIHQGVGSSEAVVKLIIEKALAQAKEPLFDGGSLNFPFSYTAFTKDQLEFARGRFESWSAANPEAYREDTRRAARIIQETNTGAANALGNAELALAFGGAFDTAESVFGTVGIVIPWSKFVAKTFKILRLISNSTAFVLPLAQVAYFVPEGVEAAVYRSFGQAPPAKTAAAATSAPKAELGNVNERLETEARAAAGLWRERLDELRAAWEENHLTSIINVMTTTSVTNLPQAAEQFNRLALAYMIQFSGAETPFFNNLALLPPVQELQFALHVEWTALNDELRSLLVDVMALSFAGADDPLYLARRDVLLAGIADLRQSIDRWIESLDILETSTGGYALLPTVYIEEVSVVAQATGGPTITQAGEAVEIRAQVRNLGLDGAGSISLRAEIAVTTHPLVLTGDALALPPGGVLAGDDNQPGGPDEVELAWQAQYTGDLTGIKRIPVQLRVLEGGAEPAGFNAIDELVILELDPMVIDSDVDGLPDDYEQAHGLILGEDDAELDLDNDGLANESEFDLGTAPDGMDSDGDGLADGEETLAGADGFVTDPLASDTDGDGMPDGADANPIDGDPASESQPLPEPSIEVDRAQVVLNAQSPVAAIAVTNGGAGTLSWTAINDDGLLALGLAEGEVRGAGELLLIGVPAGQDLSGMTTLAATIRVIDVGGVVPDEQLIQVRIGGEAGSGDWREYP